MSNTSFVPSSPNVLLLNYLLIHLPADPVLAYHLSLTHSYGDTCAHTKYNTILG